MPAIHPADPARDLRAALQNEHAAFQAFAGLLQDEQESLLRGETDYLLDGAGKKAEALLQLRQLSARRNELLARQKLAADRKGMEAWLGANPDPALETLWLDVLQAAEDARRLNETNGIIISARLRHNQQALAVLCNVARSTSLYGPDGSARLTNAARHFGAA
jgi:flagella synthesis protein FlgN